MGEESGRGGAWERNAAGQEVVAIPRHASVSTHHQSFLVQRIRNSREHLCGGYLVWEHGDGGWAGDGQPGIVNQDAHPWPPLLPQRQERFSPRHFSDSDHWKTPPDHLLASNRGPFSLN